MHPLLSRRNSYSTSTTSRSLIVDSLTMKNGVPVETIRPEDVTSADILCGRDKRSYNHVANRRFRFLTALNLERYRETESRRAKTLVVHSLYNQILDNGGRFLVKRGKGDQEFYVTVSDKVAREKISHALRDKFPLSSLRNIKAKLQQQRRGDSASQRLVDDPFIDANDMLLQVELPEARHASDDHVEIILTAELETMCNAKKQQQQQEDQEQDEAGDISPSPVTCTIAPDIQPVPLVPLSSPRCHDATAAAAAQVSPLPFYYFYHNDSSHQNTGDSTSVNSSIFGDDEASLYSSFDVANGFLPQTFSPKDCQDLVRVLDFATTL